MLEPVLRDSNIAAGNQWKHQEFSLSSLPLSKSSISLLNLNTFA